VSRLSLSEAIESGRLSDFIVQEEARGIGPIDHAEFDGAVAKVIRAPQSEDRTSRSADGGNSSGKKTRRDTDQGASD
jgi:hypothetical protein